ncbi:MAG: mobile mystery protein A, partial [Granulosicoccaceae bacterium]
RLIARKNLDKKLNTLKNIEAYGRPTRGWIKAIREALGMTTTQFGRRMGVSQPRALEIEKNEVKGTLTLDSVERAAHALNCRLVYTLVPNEPLETMIEARAKAVAKSRMKHIAHSMSLEDQAVSKAAQEEALQKLVRKLSDKSGSELWEEP